MGETTSPIPGGKAKTFHDRTTGPSRNPGPPPDTGSGVPRKPKPSESKPIETEPAGVASASDG